MTVDWREFEQLVARIKHALVPKGAVIKSPDHIKDKITGQSREVDVSIRYQDGANPVLITIECRKRGDVQDDTWIEQLITKRIKIGATKTIAVSSSGFTKSAIKSAQHFGIELRRIDDISDEEIGKFAENLQVDVGFLDYSIISFQIHFETDRKIEGLELDPILHNANRQGFLGTVIMFQKENNQPVTVQMLVEALLEAKTAVVDGVGESSIADSVEVGGPKIRRIIQFEVEKSMEPAYYSLTNYGRFDVRSVQLVVDLQRRCERVPLSNIVQYSNLNEPFVQVAEGTIPLGDRKSLIVSFTPETIVLASGTKDSEGTSDTL